MRYFTFVQYNYWLNIDFVVVIAQIVFQINSEYTTTVISSSIYHNVFCQCIFKRFIYFSITCMEDTKFML